MLGGSSLRATGDAHHYGIAILTKPRPSQTYGIPELCNRLREWVERVRADLRAAGVDRMMSTLLER